MPKEQINIPARRVITEHGPGLKPGEWAMGWAQDGEGLSEGQHWENTPALDVAWGPSIGDEKSMQFHMEVDADEVLRAAAEIQRLRDTPDVPGLTSWRFSTVVLSRTEAQKAIKVIRRARDAVYGADE